MDFKALRAKIGKMADYLNLPEKYILPLLSLQWGCSESGNKPDLQNIDVGWLGNKHSQSLLYNGLVFFRVSLPFLICLKIRWSGSTTKKSYMDFIIGWKHNGDLAITFRIQSDQTSAAGTYGPNVNQHMGWKCGTH